MPASAPALGQRLKDATAAAHAAAERAAFVRALLGGRVGKAAYLGLLRSLHPVYDALEGALQARRAHPAVAAVFEPALHRRDTLDRDLAALHGPGWAERLVPVAPALRLAERIRGLATAAPAQLVAHAYVRYLGDLNGGQLLRRAVARALALPGDAGLAFYDFGDARSARRLDERFRLGLARIEPGEHEAIVAEAVAAFALHEQLFDALDDAAPRPGPRGP